MAQAVGPDTEGAIPGSNNGEGIGVLVSCTAGVWNTGTGSEALNHLTAGNQNTATGLRALFSDTNGGFNTATGVLSLFSNTSGFFNSATGAYSLAHNTDGTSNTANGYSALYFNTEGDGNTATGFAALYRNKTGFGNTANGYQALNNNTTGNANTALGVFAGNGVTTADNVVCVGSGAAGENFSNRAYIPNIGLFDQPSGGGVEFVTVRLSDGKLGHSLSSRRGKEDIKPMDNASELIYKLKPVTFKYKPVDVDPNKGPEPQNLDYGLIAEDVAEIDPKLAIRDGKGQIKSLRYMAIYNMMLNEFLKEHRKVEGLEVTVAHQRKDFEVTIAQQQKEIRALTAQLEEQAAQIQKVSAQLEVSKPAPRTVQNDQ